MAVYYHLQLRSLRSLSLSQLQGLLLQFFGTEPHPFPWVWSAVQMDRSGYDAETMCLVYKIPYPLSPAWACGVAFTICLQEASSNDGSPPPPREWVMAVVRNLRIPVKSSRQTPILRPALAECCVPNSSSNGYGDQSFVQYTICCFIISILRTCSRAKSCSLKGYLSFGRDEPF